ncbi:MAG: 6-carboxytetrahydropterin synthase [Bacteroidia bacterium]|nr:6-carboxytetrahydropterin synthase [Bacteroidia bacterium]
MVFLTRRETFNAAHRLFNPNWDDEKNFEVFGVCANKNYHGHNYELFVTVKGEPNPETGIITNLKELSTIIKKEIIDKIDHKNIDMDVDFMKGKMSTTENLSIAIFNELKNVITDCELHRVKVQETENNCAEYFGALDA